MIEITTSNSMSVKPCFVEWGMVIPPDRNSTLHIWVSGFRNCRADLATILPRSSGGSFAWYPQFAKSLPMILTAATAARLRTTRIGIFHRRKYLREAPPIRDLHRGLEQADADLRIALAACGKHAGGFPFLATAPCRMRSLAAASCSPVESPWRPSLPALPAERARRRIAECDYEIGH